MSTQVIVWVKRRPTCLAASSARSARLSSPACRRSCCSLAASRTCSSSLTRRVAARQLDMCVRLAFSAASWPTCSTSRPFCSASSRLLRCSAAVRGSSGAPTGTDGFPLATAVAAIANCKSRKVRRQKWRRSPRMHANYVSRRNCENERVSCRATQTGSSLHSLTKRTARDSRNLRCIHPRGWLYGHRSCREHAVRAEVIWRLWHSARAQAHKQNPNGPSSPASPDSSPNIAA